MPSRQPSSAPSPHHPPPSPGGFLGGLAKLLLLIILLVLVVLPFTPAAGKIKRALAEIFQGKTTVREVIKRVEVPVQKVVERKVVEKVEVEVPAPPPPLPSNFVPRKETDLASLFNGISINTQLQTSQGTYASLEKLDPAAYQVRFQVDIRIPKANQSVDELARINPELPKALPGLRDMLSTSRISGFYHLLYDNKVKAVSRDLTRLNKVLDRHNFFDCETILELKHPTTSRKALLIQSEMDVVADGSDGDRMASMTADIYQSDYYQPFTSYAWKKQTKTPNPLLARWETRLKDAKAEYAKKGLTAERYRQLKALISQLTLEITDFKSRSSLIAETDPFIVLSLLFRNQDKNSAHTPQIGDYAVVIHGNQILPAICGDYGPSMKMGEASLLMAKQINPKATPYWRGESDLKVSYLIFPGTAKKPFGPPNLVEWRNQCIQYLGELGGIGSAYHVHEWVDVIQWKRDFVGPPWPLPKASS